MTKEELEALEHAARQFYNNSRLAAMLGMKLDDLKAELIAERTPRAQAIVRGRQARETAIREAILDSAVQGSTPAQAMAMNMLKELDQ